VDFPEKDFQNRIFGMVVFRWLLCVMISAAVALAGNQPDTPKPDASKTAAYPNLILITLDTTRADRMGFMGSKRGLTPNLDAVAQQCVIFTRAYSQAPLTDVSHATMLTGTYPQYHQVLTFPIPLGKDLPWMPEILKFHGYQTAAFVGSLALDPSWGVPGFERGFDTYNAGFTWKDYSPKTRYQTTQRRGSEVVERALTWLNQRPAGPFFLWVHVFDAHDPYDPPEPYKTRYAKALYDGGIAYEDDVMGKLFKELKARGLYDGAAIVVTADHGESLGAHGEDTHGVFLYDETIHVPLFIKLPQGDARAAAKRVDERVELTDIMPTILGTARIEVPKEVQGVSLLELMKPGPEDATAAEFWRDRGAYSEADYGHLSFAWSAEQSLRTGRYLFIQAPRRELYDESVDTKAAKNLALSSPAVADTLAARLETFIQKTTNTAETPKSIMDDDRTRKLSALGYVATGNNPAFSTSPERGADLKDRIAIANLVHEVTNFLQDWKCEKAIPVLRRAIAKDPNISLFHFYLGGCYMEAKDFEKAVPEFRMTVKLDPSFTSADMNLGRALMTLQDYAGAVPVFEHVETMVPKLMDAHIYLVVAYERTNQVEKEIAECRTVLQSLPDHFGANLNLGRFLAQSGDLQGAIPSLQKAESLRPNDPVPRMYLADVYGQLGREEDAKRERAEAERLGATPLGSNPDASTDARKPNPQ
jgi:arylsulfatase A-like enzyme/cytochrome c-type biogenesis protein CcmH/NrfG